MIEYANDPSLYLYYYTSSETALKILESGAIRLGCYRNTNDPKESKDWHFSVGVSERSSMDHSTALAMSDWLSSTIKSTARLACFCTDSPPLTGNHLNDIFKRGYCKPRMWAQYGDNHSGVCLIFRINDFLEATRLRFDKTTPRFYGEVQYVNRPIVPNLFSLKEQQYMIDLESFEAVGRDQYLLHHAVTHRNRLFFEKMTDWENEREWRFVALISGDEDVYIPFQNSLAGVMFGENIGEERTIDLIEAAKEYKPWFMGLKRHNCSPWYDYENRLFLSQYRSESTIAKK